MKFLIGSTFFAVAMLTSLARAAAPVPPGDNVSFTAHDGYFVSNKFEPDAAASFVVIDDQKTFDQIFGAAFVMNDRHHRMPANAFDSNIVLAAIKRGSAVWTYAVDGITSDAGVVTIRYTTTFQPHPTAQFASPLIVTIARRKYAAIRFGENGEAISQIDTAAAVPPLAGSKARPAFASVPIQKNGLEMTLVGDKSVFAGNEPLKFSVRFKNVSDKPVSLNNADHFWGWKVRLYDAQSGNHWRLQTLAVESLMPAAVAKELKPGESWEVAADWSSAKYPFEYVSEIVQNMDIPPVDFLYPSRYRLYVAATFEKPAESNAAQASAWTGEISAGPVEIEITRESDPKSIQMSEPVQENQVQFQTVAKPQWALPAAGAKTEIELGLKITNRTPRWMQINVFDTVEVVIKDVNGVELACKAERDATHIPAPLLLRSREGQTVYRNATLEWTQDHTLRLIGPDGAGGNWYCDGLKAGRYTVHCIFECSPANLEAVLTRPGKGQLDPKEAPFWTGKATTKDLSIEIGDTSH